MKPVRVKSKKPKKQQKSRQPKRWLLNAFIYLLIFINGLIILIAFAAMTYQNELKSDQLLDPKMYGYAFMLALATIFFLINLSQLRRWAFWGYCLCTLGTIALNIFIGTKIATALLGLGGPIILFGLLYMGDRRSAWREMDKLQQ